MRQAATALRDVLLGRCARELPLLRAPARATARPAARTARSRAACRPPCGPIADGISSRRWRRSPARWPMHVLAAMLAAADLAARLCQQWRRHRASSRAGRDASLSAWSPIWTRAGAGRHASIADGRHAGARHRDLGPATRAGGRSFSLGIADAVTVLARRRGRGRCGGDDRRQCRRPARPSGDRRVPRQRRSIPTAISATGWSRWQVGALIAARDRRARCAPGAAKAEALRAALD